MAFISSLLLLTPLSQAQAIWRERRGVRKHHGHFVSTFAWCLLLESFKVSYLYCVCSKRLVVRYFDL